MTLYWPFLIQYTYQPCSISLGFKEINDGGRYFTSIFATNFRSEAEAELALYQGYIEAFVIAANNAAACPAPGDRPFLNKCLSVFNSHPVTDTALSAASRTTLFASLLLASQVPPESVMSRLAFLRTSYAVTRYFPIMVHARLLLSRSILTASRRT